MKNIISALFLSITLASVANAAIGLRAPEDIVYTLYRSSAVPGGELKRIHVATFDAAGGEDYNLENCNIVRQLLQAQPGVTVKYWCEKGYFRK